MRKLRHLKQLAINCICIIECMIQTRQAVSRDNVESVRIVSKKDFLGSGVVQAKTKKKENVHVLGYNSKPGPYGREIMCLGKSEER